MIYLAIPLIGWSIFLIYAGLCEAHELTNKKALLGAIAPPFIGALFFSILNVIF